MTYYWQLDDQVCIWPGCHIHGLPDDDRAGPRARYYCFEHMTKVKVKLPFGYPVIQRIGDGIDWARRREVALAVAKATALQADRLAVAHCAAACYGLARAPLPPARLLYGAPVLRSIGHGTVSVMRHYANYDAFDDPWIVTVASHEDRKRYQDSKESTESKADRNSRVALELLARNHAWAYECNTFEASRFTQGLHLTQQEASRLESRGAPRSDWGRGYY